MYLLCNAFVCVLKTTHVEDWNECTLLKTDDVPPLYGVLKIGVGFHKTRFKMRKDIKDQIQKCFVCCFEKRRWISLSFGFQG